MIFLLCPAYSLTHLRLWYVSSQFALTNGRSFLVAVLSSDPVNGDTTTFKRHTKTHKKGGPASPSQNEPAKGTKASIAGGAVLILVEGLLLYSFTEGPAP